MNWKTAAVLMSGLLVACAQTSSPEATAPPEQAQALATAPAQPPPSAQPPVPAPAPAAGTAPVDHIVNIRGASCEDLLRLSPEDREAAAMFYIGYQASRFRARTINVGVIPSIEAQAVTYCTENPRRSIAQAFAEAYSRTPR